VRWRRRATTLPLRGEGCPESSIRCVHMCGVVEYSARPCIVRGTAQGRISRTVAGSAAPTGERKRRLGLGNRAPKALGSRRRF
jgi:hypothetical protein